MIIEYVLSELSPFTLWFNSLDAIVAAKVTTALYRLSQCNFSNIKGVGGGVLEYKIDFGPGYRIYFGNSGMEIILLGGGSKKQQSRDISLAKKRWKEYKQDRK